jgi:hypothetical protein
MSEQKEMSMTQQQKPLAPEMPEKLSPEIDLIAIPEHERDIEKIVGRIEKDVAIFKKIKIVALKLTSERDWLLQKSKANPEGSPYLQDRGAEQIRIAFGVDVSGLQLNAEWLEDERGRYVTFIASGKAFSKKLGSYIEDIGTCSQRDRFFAKVGDRFKELEEVDLTNVRKKAVTNLYNRLIKRMTGVLNVTVDDLKLAQLDISKIPSLDYEEGKAKREAALSNGSKSQRDELSKIAKLMSENDAEEKAWLKKLSLFKDQDQKEHFIESINQLTSEKWIASLLGKAKGELKKSLPDIYEQMYPAAEEKKR